MLKHEPSDNLKFTKHKPMQLLKTMTGKRLVIRQICGRNMSRL